jgi:cation transport regulator ChaB
MHQDYAYCLDSAGIIIAGGNNNAALNTPIQDAVDLYVRALNNVFDQDAGDDDTILDHTGHDVALNASTLTNVGDDDTAISCNNQRKKYCHCKKYYRQQRHL